MIVPEFASKNKRLYLSSPQAETKEHLKQTNTKKGFGPFLFLRRCLFKSSVILGGPYAAVGDDEEFSTSC